MCSWVWRLVFICLFHSFDMPWVNDRISLTFCLVLFVLIWNKNSQWGKCILVQLQIVNHFVLAQCINEAGTNLNFPPYDFRINSCLISNKKLCLLVKIKLLMCSWKTSDRSQISCLWCWCCYFSQLMCWYNKYVNQNPVLVFFQRCCDHGRWSGVRYAHCIMMSWPGNIFHVTGSLWLWTCGFTSQSTSNMELWCFLWCTPEQIVETVEQPVIWNAMMPMWCHCNDELCQCISVSWRNGWLTVCCLHQCVIEGWVAHCVWCLGITVCCLGICVPEGWVAHCVWCLGITVCCLGICVPEGWVAHCVWCLGITVCCLGISVSLRDGWLTVCCVCASVGPR